MITEQHYLPAEWESQSAILLAWPHEKTDWAERLASVEDTYIALVSAIVKFEKALICVADSRVEARAKQCLDNAGVDCSRIHFEQLPYDDTWLRDSGPITLRSNTSNFRLLDFRFTAWGGKFEAALDDKIVATLHKHNIFENTELERIDFALEGGAIETDGAGTLLSTWRCLHERHPNLSRAEITTRLQHWLYQVRTLWLDHGYLEGDDTDAHIDTLARFAPNDGLVYQSCDDASDPHYNELQAMANELAAFKTIDGRPYRLFELPWPKPIIDAGRRLAASYANFLVVNGAVLMPAYDDIADDIALKVLAEAFPGREIIAIPCRALLWQNGSLHCITMQLPKGLLA